MIAKHPFGRAGHQSTRVIFGAAALGGMKQDKADAILELLLEYGINHIKTAAAYGYSEQSIGLWMRDHRQNFFLATKTGVGPTKRPVAAFIARSNGSRSTRSI